MQRPIESVLFDLDGTLVDTAPDFIYVLNLLLEENNKAPLPAELIRAHVSDGTAALVAMAFQVDRQDPGLEPLRQRLLTLYEANLAVNSKPFPGITDLLATLATAGIPWGIVTNKPVRYAEPLLNQLDLTPTYAALICPDHVSQPKPHPEALLKACSRIGCRAENSIYVGDHRRDIEAGAAAGMTTIAAGFGYIKASDPISKWLADHQVESAQEIEELILRRLAEH